MKLLLYCTKGKPLFRCSGWNFNNFFDEYVCARDYYNYFRDYETVDEEDLLNGKVVAECDFEVGNITYKDNCYHFEFKNAYENVKRTCLSFTELDNYLKHNNGYAIHIKNLHIFDEPKELSEFYKPYVNSIYIPHVHSKTWERVNKAPQNMMYCYDKFGNECILISIHPEWLCKILNGEKTIEVRKKVLRGMFENL